MADLVVIGAGGHAASVAESATASGFNMVCFVDPDRSDSEMLGIPVLASPPRDSLDAGAQLVVAIGDNAARERVVASMQTSYPQASYATIIHPSASVSSFAVVGKGSVVLQGAVVGSRARVGSFVIINSLASVDHDCLLEDFASLAPGVILGGEVVIQRGAAVSIGALVRHRRTVGSNAVVGGGSYVDSDVPPLVVAYGSPARVIRSRAPEDPYL